MFKVTLEEAEELIKNYRIHFLNVANPKVPNAIGGTLEKDHILELRQRWESSRRQDKLNDPNMELHEGLGYWCCWKEGATMVTTDFFLAFEFNDGLVIDYEGLQFPDNPILARPFEIVDDDPNLNTTDLLANKTGTGPNPPLHDTTIRKGNRFDEVDTVLKSCQSFKDNGPRQVSMIPYNRLPFGLFENKNASNDVNDFFDNNEGLTFIRYYFGYKPDITVNKIRVILVAVNSDGENLLPTSRTEKNGNFILLETSWPPKQE